MDKNHYVIIMAGGVGSRFWPVSRTRLPKQFIDVLGTGRTLIQATYDRFKGIVPEENIYILTNKQYVSLVREQLGMKHDNQIISEPVMRNTAPCITYACRKLYAQNERATVVIAPSDHLIQETNLFIRDIQLALEAASAHEALITLGIKPSRPDTGYGYIQAGTQRLGNYSYFGKVNAFREKPDAQTAWLYLESGAYLWNAGIFVWQAKTALRELQQHAPSLYAIFEAGSDCYNTPFETDFIEAHYSACENISIDYALMERSDRVYVLPADFGWSDLGTWTSVYGLCDHDAAGNALIADAKNVMLYNSSNCMVSVPGFKKVVLRNLHNYMVVEANDTLLICPIDSEQEVKQVVADAAIQFGENYV